MSLLACPVCGAAPTNSFYERDVPDVVQFNCPHVHVVEAGVVKAIATSTAATSSSKFKRDFKRFLS